MLLFIDKQNVVEYFKRMFQYGCANLYLLRILFSVNAVLCQAHAKDRNLM